MPTLVHAELADGIAVLTIDNPPVNALSGEVWEAIDAAVAHPAADPAVQGIVLIGVGRATSRGPTNTRILSLVSRTSTALPISWYGTE